MGSQSILLIMDDVIFIKIHERDNKLSTRFEGPYRVIGYKHGNQLIVKHIPSYETIITHVDHVKRASRAFDSGEELLDLHYPPP